MEVQRWREDTRSDPNEVRMTFFDRVKEKLMSTPSYPVKKTYRLMKINILWYYIMNNVKIVQCISMGPSSLTDGPGSEQATSNEATDAFKHMFVPNVYDIRSSTPKVIRSEGTYVINSCTAYACTFTFNEDHEYNINENRRLSKEMVKLIDAPKIEQQRYFNMRFSQWIKKLKRSLSSFMYKCEIPAYECYAEYTQKGLIHGHALVWINNNYVSGISNIMSDLWAKINKGVKKSAMFKKTHSGVDKAFDGCTSIDAWRKYITKEYPTMSMLPCYIPETPYNVNMLFDD